MSDRYPDALLRFVARFDRREYWLAHEELEELWLTDRQDLYKGLIQAAAALLHAQRGNWRGAVAKARHAIGHLEAQCKAGGAFDVEAIVERLRDAMTVAEPLARDRRGADHQAFERLCFELRPLFAGADRIEPVEREDLPYRVRRHEDGYRVGREPRRRD